MTEMEVKAKRSRLESVRAEHVGLLLNRDLSQHDDTHAGAKELYKKAQDTAVGEVYRKAVARWKSMVQSLPHTCLFTATAATPIAVGLGNESVLEVGLTIHHTYGVPIIPGSALKGLCRRGALRLEAEGRITRQQKDTLFGFSAENGDASAGYITFWDALYDPESVSGKPFHRDVITVHHPDYYSSQGRDACPTDFDDPNPVPFLVVRPGARFLFALTAPDDSWAEFTQKLLQWCLREMGVGAKTNAGYGYFAVGDSVARSPEAKRQTPQPVPPPEPSKEVWTDVIVSYNPGQQVLQVQRTIEGRSQGASADAQRTRLLLATLSETARKKLTEGKRRLLADVEIDVSGNKRTITHIKPKE